MKTDKLERKLRFLMGGVSPYYLWEMSPEAIENQIPKNSVKVYHQIYDICNILKLDRKVVDKLWWKTYFDRQDLPKYDKNYPVKMKKDNKDVKVYGNTTRGLRQNTIRVPKKCRKTAWKRFYKLFPERKPEIEYKHHEYIKLK